MSAGLSPDPAREAGKLMHGRRGKLEKALFLLCALIPCLGASIPACAQDANESSPSAALSAILAAACRRNAEIFARYLPGDNATAYRGLSATLKTELMKRMVPLADAGKPLHSSSAEGTPVLRCDSPAETIELRLGAERVQKNLAFVPMKVTDGGSTTIGLVREDGGWRLLSVGLVLLDVSALSVEWEAQQVEAREARVIAALRQLAEAVSTYRKAFGRLPDVLAQLGSTPNEGASPEAAKLVDDQLAAGTKFDYQFRYRVFPGPSGTPDGFDLAATPVEYGRSGQRSFFLDASGILRGGDKKGAVATNADPRIEERRRGSSQ